MSSPVAPYLTTLKQCLSLNWKLAGLARWLTREFLGSASLYLHCPVLELQTHTTVPGFLRGPWGFELGCACTVSALTHSAISLAQFLNLNEHPSSLKEEITGHHLA